MKIGVPREIKDKENRVALTPAGAAVLVGAGHEVLVQTGAGTGCGFPDAEYRAAGARLGSVAEAWDRELVLKVKEPLEPEFAFLGRQILFTYLHLAGVGESLSDALLRSGTTAIGYETVEDAQGRLPLLAPMSAVAGNMAVTMGSYYLAGFNGGKGTQLGQVLGRRYGKVVIIGDGVVGRHAAQVAVAMGTEVHVAGKQPVRLPELRRECGKDLQFLLSEPQILGPALENADLVVGAVLLRGARAPHVVTREMVQRMQPGSVIVDVSIDQGGCVETSRPTSHSDPVFEQYGVTHYCVTNMPGAYPRTATLALTDATLPYVQRLADLGLACLREDAGLAKGLNTHDGHLTCMPVAEALGRRERYRSLADLGL